MKWASNGKAESLSRAPFWWYCVQGGNMCSQLCSYHNRVYGPTVFCNLSSAYITKLWHFGHISFLRIPWFCSSICASENDLGQSSDLHQILSQPKLKKRTVYNSLTETDFASFFLPRHSVLYTFLKEIRSVCNFMTSAFLCCFGTDEHVTDTVLYTSHHISDIYTNILVSKLNKKKLD